MRSAIAVLMLALALGLAGSATAATITLNGSTLVFTAAAGIDNGTSADPDGAGNVMFTDYAETITAGAGCTGSGTSTVICPLAGVTGISVALLDGNDTFQTTLDEPGIALTVDGGPGNDMLYGTPQANTLLGGDGDDELRGREGDDTITAGNGNDTVVGGDGNDTIDGGAGDDLLSGEAGQDTIVAGAGADQVDGGFDDDHLDTNDGEADNVAECGDGNDTLVHDDLDTQIYHCENVTSGGGGGGGTTPGGGGTTPGGGGTTPTPTPYPSVAFAGVSALTAHGAHVDVTVEPNPDTITLTFALSPMVSGCDPSTGNALPAYPAGYQLLGKTVPPSTSRQKIGFDLSGLPPNATIAATLDASNSAASVHVDAGQLFTTSDDGAATTAGDVTATSATLRGTVTPGWIDTTYGSYGYKYSMGTSWLFELGRDKAYGLNKGGGSFGSTDYCPHLVSFTMTGLVPATTYHYRVRRNRNWNEQPGCPVVDPLTGCPLASSGTYVDYGADITFTTSTSQVSPTGTVGGGAVILTTTCEMTKTCSGKGKIVILPSCKKGVKACPAAKTAARPVVLAQGRFRVRGKGKVRLPLTAAGRRAIKGSKKVEARLTLSVRGPQGKAITTSQALTVRR